MTPDRRALLEIQNIVAKAMPPDSGATVGELLGEISGPLADVGLDPISEVIVLPDDQDRFARVVPLHQKRTPVAAGR